MSKKVRIAGIVKESIVDGPGIRFVVFAQGCKHSCPGCHNPNTHDFNGGCMMDVESILDEVKKDPLVDGITISGGEPFEQAEALGELAAKAKDMGYNIMTYTGYTFESIVEQSKKMSAWEKLLKKTDILVDGRFEQDKKSYQLEFRGSANQRAIHVEKSLQSNEVIPYQFKSKWL